MPTTLLGAVLGLLVLGVCAWLYLKVTQILREERAQTEQETAEEVTPEEDARREDALLEAFNHPFFDAVDDTVKLFWFDGLRKDGRLVLPSWCGSDTIDCIGQLVQLRQDVELRAAQRHTPSEPAR